jgi:hypothetical protein
MVILLATVILAAVLAGPTLGADPAPPALSTPPGWQMPQVKDVRAQVSGWLNERKVDEKGQTAVLALWPLQETELAGPEMLARLARSFALVDPQAQRLVDFCSSPRSGPVLPNQPWLHDPTTHAWMAHNLRLLYGRWLVHQSLYDEALEQLADLQPQQVVDPASLLFYQTVVYYRLLDQKSGTKAAERLLEGTAQSPKRYAAVARLMREDLKELKPDSLDHIARRMDDIRRRLQLGRAGQKVRSVEDGVIASLDKLIQKIEKQEQQQQQASAGGSMQPSSPAPDSRILGGRGRGEVTKKDIGEMSGWGNLPPKQRDEALQQIGRDFPAHYRDVIEQYFRRMAGEGSQ